MVLAPPVIWYHGGVPGLEPGDLILPRCRTGVPRFNMRDDARPDVVYVTSDVSLATAFAALWSICPWLDGNGDVYRVAPDESMPWRSALEATCSRARVTGVVTRSVTRQCGYALGDGLGAGLRMEDAAWSAVRALGFPVPARRRVIVRECSQ